MHVHPATAVRAKRRVGDVVFRGVATGSGIAIIVFIALIGVFLLTQAIPSLQADRVNFLTSPEFNTDDAANLQFGIRDLLVVTVLSSAVALVIAVPVAVAVAVFLTNYAPFGARGP